MAARIDVFSLNANFGAEFTVDITKASVPLTASAFNQKLRCGLGGSVGANRYLFKAGECFTILSAGFVIPENFVLSNYDMSGGGELTLPIFSLSIENELSGMTKNLIYFGNNGFLRIPFENYEMSLGTFVDAKKLGMGDENFWIKGTFPFILGADNPMISMQNVPATLNGVKFYVTPFVKILHNDVIL